MINLCAYSLCMSEDKKVWYLDKMNLFIKQLPCQPKNVLVTVICHFSSFNFGVMNLTLLIFYFLLLQIIQWSLEEIEPSDSHAFHCWTSLFCSVVLDVFYTYCWYWLLVVCFKFLSLLNAKRDLRILTGDTHCLLSLSTENCAPFIVSLDWKFCVWS